MKRTSAATGLVNSILAYLRLRGLHPWRNQCGAIPIPRPGGRGHRMVRMGTPGLPDVLCVIPPHGRLLAVEAKTGSGRLSPAQRATIDNLNEAGALAFVARDLDDLRREVDHLLEDMP